MVEDKEKVDITYEIVDSEVLFKVSVAKVKWGN